MAQKIVSGVLTPLCLKQKYFSSIIFQNFVLDVEYIPNNASPERKIVANEKNQKLEESINQVDRAFQGYIEFVQDYEGLLIFTKDGEIIAVFIVGKEYVADDEEEDPEKDGDLFEMDQHGTVDISSINVHDLHCNTETMDAIFILLNEYASMRKYLGITLPRILPVQIFGRIEDEEYFTKNWGCLPDGNKLVLIFSV
jgi:hypothetical protein